jgi:hypothetical protein|tara:strand:- start:237 stop:665 length:429 start_codon:yes stop_codon:yes gene_type:complete
MNERWYQATEISSEEVYDDISESIQCSVEWKKLIQMNQRLPYRVLDIGKISLIIKECMAEEFDRYGGFGSHRGYAYSTRHSLWAAIKQKIHEYYRKKAITILKNSFIIDNWINHVLYSPGGIRYKIHKTSFQKLTLLNKNLK